MGPRGAVDTQGCPGCSCGRRAVRAGDKGPETRQYLERPCRRTTRPHCKKCLDQRDASAMVSIALHSAFTADSAQRA